MAYCSGKRFGITAIEKGYISKGQLFEAMKVQIENELEGMTSRFIGAVLHSMGYLSIDQIDEVLGEMSQGENCDIPP